MSWCSFLVKMLTEKMPIYLHRFSINQDHTYRDRSDLAVRHTFHEAAADRCYMPQYMLFSIHNVAIHTMHIALAWD